MNKKSKHQRTSSGQMPVGIRLTLLVMATCSTMIASNWAHAGGFVQQRWTGAWGSDGPIFTGDLNGDGKTDVFMWRASDKSWTVNLSTGSGFTQQRWTGAWGSDGPIFTGDLNGDGKTDVFMWRASDKSWTVNLSTGSGFTQQRWTGAWGSDGPIFTGDLNDDGKTDVFMWRASDKSWTVNLSTGSGFTQQRWVGAWGSDGPIHAGDLNGDETTDVLMWRGTDRSWTINLSNGTGFIQQRWTGAWGSDGPIFTGDLNGDGKTDIFMWRDSDKSWAINLSNGDPIDSAFSDMDGVPTAIENELLDRFRPFYRFSMNGNDDETARPIDARTFVINSNLMDHHSETDTPLLTSAQLTQDPLKILDVTSKGPSSTTQTTKESGYYLNISNDLRGGEGDWSKIENEAVGLYGHVTSLREDSVLKAYKIEYWQLYAYDEVPGQHDCWIVHGPAGGGSNSHEGDWVGVELVVEPDQHTIRRVRHNIHSASVVFDLKNGHPVDIGGSVLEYRGTGTGKPYTHYIDLNVAGPAGIDWAQNNLVRFFCNENGCTHPLVYIEHGGHEAWPTEYWNWPVVFAHAGDSPHRYLVTKVQNVGEIGRPTPGCEACALVVGFNGHWGACGDDPPDGPPTKGTWGKP